MKFKVEPTREGVFVSDVLSVYIGVPNFREELPLREKESKKDKFVVHNEIYEEALFYLRTRGIPINEARGLLTYAFANNVLDSVKIPKLKSRINQIISSKLKVKIRHEL